MKTIIDEKWIREIYNSDNCFEKEFTFVGALEDRYHHVAFHWNKRTRHDNELIYNNKILPALKDHNEKSIREYTKEDYEKAIDSIKENGFEDNGIRYPYAEATIKKFERLIYYVVFQAAQCGYCDNVLWGSRFELEMPSIKDEIEDRTVLKKSLTPAQEKAILSQLLDYRQEGSKFALLFMFGDGFRNAEACGTNFGDVKSLIAHQECKVMWIYKTTQIDSNKLQSSGKTFNTGRIVPLPELIVDLIDKRRQYVSDCLEKLGVDGIDIDTLPICSVASEFRNNAEDFLTRCKADDVTNMAHIVFENAGINPKQIAYLDAELAENGVAIILREKEPTAYLLRRNFATHLHVLGLELSEIQYLMGHSIDDVYESRNDYVDDERIYGMYLKLKNRPLLNTTETIPGEFVYKSDERETIKVYVIANEPGDAIKVSCIYEAEAEQDISKGKIEWYSCSKKKAYPRSVDIIKHYQAVYK